MQLKRRSVLLAGLAVTLLAIGAMWRLTDHDLERRASERFDVLVAGERISGTLWLPGQAPQAAVILVHGDGPQDRTSAGGYAPLINLFLDRGIAVASWDKPGVGQSSGNWLHQSMHDRTVEVRSALAVLNERFPGIATGALGFSQAGWVLPALTPNDADFVTLIGPAVSWQDQGRYYTEVRLRQQGLSPSAIERVMAKEAQDDARASTDAARPADRPDGLSDDRWRFILQNRDADARALLARFDVPLLAIWGADDLNVDAAQDAAIYEALLADRTAENRILIWPDATHGLLKAAAYNWQLQEQWTWPAKLRFLAEGRYAFAPGALDTIADWIVERIEAHPPSPP